MDAEAFMAADAGDEGFQAPPPGRVEGAEGQPQAQGIAAAAHGLPRPGERRHEHGRRARQFELAGVGYESVGKGQGGHRGYPARRRWNASTSAWRRVKPPAAAAPSLSGKRWSAKFVSAA